MPTPQEIRAQLALERKNRADGTVSAYTNLIAIEMAKETEAEVRRSAWFAMQQANDNYADTQVPGSPNHTRSSSFATYCNNQKTAMYNQYLAYGDNVDAWLIKKSAAEGEALAALNYYNSVIA